ncbi:MAG: hypothetical protein GC160_19960 [Acidobacteria bacterium]|nr:hypothetical protein [Acidobacteriota bacterium]
MIISILLAWAKGAPREGELHVPEFGADRKKPTTEANRGSGSKPRQRSSAHIVAARFPIRKPNRPRSKRSWSVSPR